MHFTIVGIHLAGFITLKCSCSDSLAIHSETSSLCTATLWLKQPMCFIELSCVIQQPVSPADSSIFSGYVYVGPTDGYKKVSEVK